MADDEASARATDPWTSHEAADSIAGTRVSELQRIVLSALRDHGPMSAEQVADRTAIDKQSITPRFRPLRELGLVEQTGSYSVNRSGRRSIVWRAVTPTAQRIPAQGDLLSDRS